MRSSGTPDRKPRDDAMAAAMRMLARREHSEHELAEKLVANGFERGLAKSVVGALKAENLVSDQRFVEAWLSNRTRRGYGPLRIRHELLERGVPEPLIDQWVDMNDPDWLARLREVWQKKYGERRPSTYREWARQARFLQGRGFSAEQIKQVLPF